MVPLDRCTAPLACPADHSLSSRTSTRMWPSRGIALYSSMVTSLTRDFASSTSFRNPGLWPLCGTDMLIHPLNPGACALQLFLNSLVPAVDVINTIHDRLSLRSETCQYQRGA